jgi:hypothetical protein
MSSLPELIENCKSVRKGRGSNELLIDYLPLRWE